MKIIGKMVFLAAACALSAPAAAQTSNSPGSLLANPVVMAQISAADVASMMAELGVTTELQASDAGGPPFLIAKTPGNGRFVFQFFSCDDAANAAGCANTVVSTAFPSAGVTFDDINDFNRQSHVTTAISLGDPAIVILGRNIIVYGGHSRDLFKGTVYLFLRDVQGYAERTTATSVAFSATPEKALKINGLRKSSAQNGATAPFGKADLSADLATAVAFSKDADFKIDFESASRR